MEKLKSIILNDKAILDGVELIHLISLIDIFKHSTNTFAVLFDRDIVIRFSFKHWNGWHWNDVMLVDSSKMSQLEGFSQYSARLRADLLGIHNALLPENTSSKTYFISIGKEDLAFDKYLFHFCSKELRAKLDYLLLTEGIKGGKEGSKKSSKI